MNIALLVLRVVPALVGRAAIALAIGVGAGLVTVLVGYVARSAVALPGVPATS